MGGPGLADPHDELVSSVGLYRQRHWLLHGHVGPYGVVYAVWLYVWLAVLGVEEYYEAGLIALAGLGLGQVRRWRQQLESLTSKIRLHFRFCCA